MEEFEGRPDAESVRPTSQEKSGDTPVRARVSGETPESSASSLLPSVDLPKGGGAIRGIGEKLNTDLATGSASLSIPVAMSMGRAGFSPSLSLSYSAGQGNGPFGLGFRLSVPSITRKTDKGLPRYFDDEHPDTFILAGAEDLVSVPALREDGEYVARLDRGTHWVRRFQPRKEGLFARIEEWTSKADPYDSHWRVTTPDNVTHSYGRTPQARIASGKKIFSWLLEETREPRGQAIAYEYAREDGRGLDASQEDDSRILIEDNRAVLEDGHPVLLADAHRYLARVRYGNRYHIDRDDPLPTQPDAWLFELVFDYGDYDAPSNLDADTNRVPRPEDPSPATPGAITGPRDWLRRADPFSDHRATFERRQYRLCRRVLCFHRMPEHEDELGVTPCLVKSTDFEYEQTPFVTYLRSVTHAAYRWLGFEYERATMPPLEFEYGRLDSIVDVVTRPPEPPEDDEVDLPLGDYDGRRSDEEWVDYDGEGLPGLLSRGSNWGYRRNLGKGVVAADADRLEVPIPREAQLGVQLVDLTRDGKPDLVSYEGPLPGYFARDRLNDWSDLVAFPPDGRTVVDLSEDRTWLVDLDGNGEPDILVVRGSSLLWLRSKGRAGFAAAEAVALPGPDERSPRLAFMGDRASLFFADFNGDGLLDLAHISANEVHVWQNQGHARWADRVTVPLSKSLASHDEFDPARVRLGDFDGAGPADLVYLRADGLIDVHRNESGNRFSMPEQLDALGTDWTVDEIDIVDLLGAGTSCVVHSDRRSNGTSLSYIDPSGGKKPHLLERYWNNLGLEVRLAYRSSTVDHLRDRNAGREWFTPLPFPIQVVSRIETYDEVGSGGGYRIESFEYSHGFFDADEREFRGFAAVSHWEEEWGTSLRGKGLFNPVELVLDVDEMQLSRKRTDTWFHTGAYLAGDQLEKRLADEYFDEDGRAPLLPDTPQMELLSPSERREAARCLKGSVLREEIYAEDGAPESATPYVVHESSYGVRMLRPPTATHPGVFLTYPSESLELHYERNADDPRTTHSLNLEVDDYGNVIKLAEVAYPRRTPEFPEQAKLWATYSESRFVHRPEPANWYRVSVPAETVSYELTGLSAPEAPTDPSARFEVLDISDVLDVCEVAPRLVPEDPTASPSLRLLGATRSCYLADNLTELYVGEISDLNIPCRSYSLALTEKTLATKVDHNPDGSAAPYAEVADRPWLHDRGGYVRGADISVAGTDPPLALPIDADTGWWTPTGEVVWEADPLVSRARFYQPLEAKDPFGNRSYVELDALALLVTHSRNAYFQQTIVGNRYRTLTPWKTTDPNGNNTEVTYDALGLPIAIRQIGANGEGDQDGDPTVAIEYDLHRWRLEAKPSYSHVITKVRHGADDDGRRERSWAFANGSGGEAMVKKQAPRGRAPRRDPMTGDLVYEGGELAYDDDVPRWIGSGRTVLNNRGLPVKQYEPYYSSTWDYEDEDDLVATGVTPVLHYDPMGRLIRSEFPDGTLSEVEFDAWWSSTSDQNDLVLDSQWYANRVGPTADPDEAEAASLAVEHAQTPTRVYLDSMGRPFLSVAHNKYVRRTAVGTLNLNVDEEYETRTEYDVQGRVVSVTDPRGVVVQRQFYDLAGRPLQSVSPDSGRRWTLPDAASRPKWAWDGNGNATEQRYDQLHRPTETFVTAAGATKVMTFVVYGKDAAAPADRYLIGKPYWVFDGAGRIEHHSYDFKGNPTRTVRRLATTYSTAPDWSGAAADPNAGLEPSSAGLETRVAYDALDRPIEETAPDRISTTRRTYNEAGQPYSIEVDRRGAVKTYVASIDYNARGQRLRVQYGNKVSTDFTYDDYTFRLINIDSRRGAGKLQDLTYVYDPVGNIARVRDGVHLDAATPGLTDGAAYEYDSLYRLIRVAGREHGGQVAGGPTEWRLPAYRREGAIRQNRVDPTDIQGMRNYVENYFYDEVGNIKERTHWAGGSTTRLRYRYEGETASLDSSFDAGAAVSNRLASTRLPIDALSGPYSATYAHDANGNITSLNGMALGWDHANRLTSANLGGGGTAYYAYDQGGQRIRKRIVRSAGTTLERIYVGSYEVFRDLNTAGAATVVRLERRSLHVMDGATRVCLIEEKVRDGSVDLGDAAIVERPRFQLADHLGSSKIELTEALGTAQPKRISYEEFHAYGVSSYYATNSSDSLSWVEESPKRFRYGNKERDDETGFDHYPARYAIPWLGRWLSADPLGMVDGPNLYAFTRNNPISLSDPQGTEAAPAQEKGGDEIRPQEFTGEETREELDAIAAQHGRRIIGDPYWEEGYGWRAQLEQIDSTEGTAENGGSASSGSESGGSRDGKDRPGDPSLTDHLLAFGSGVIKGAAVGFAVGLLAMKLMAVASVAVVKGLAALLVVGSFAVGWQIGTLINQAVSGDWGVEDSETSGELLGGFAGGSAAAKAWARSGARLIEAEIAQIEAELAAELAAEGGAARGNLVIEAGEFSASEVRAAEHVAGLGRNTTLRQPVGTRAAGGTSDLLVDGVPFDVFTPRTANPNRIISAIAKKNSQADGIVLDLTDSAVAVEELGNILARVQGAGATRIKEVIVIGR